MENGWELNFRRALTDWEVDRAIILLQCSNSFKGIIDVADKPVWSHSSKGSFLVKSVYWKMNTRNCVTMEWPWKFIGKIKIPTRIACFVLLEVRRLV